MKKKCALYIRTTTAEQSGTQQRSELREYAKSRDFEITKIYEDKGVGPVRERPGIGKLLDDARNRQFEFVVMQTLDRMFCSHKHMFATLENLQHGGVGLIAVRDEIDTFSEKGGLITFLLMRFARFQEVINAERTMAGHLAMIEKRGYVGAYKKISREKITKLWEKGICQREIARRLSVGAATVSRVVGEFKIKTKREGTNP